MDYKIKAITGSGRKDAHGNEWFSVMFESGEQASWLAKNQRQVGETVYGHITDEPKKSGEGTYKRFRTAQRDVTVTGSTSPQTKFTEDPGKQDSIIRQSSMKAAVDLVVGGKAPIETLFIQADSIVAWVKNEPKLDPLPETKEPKEELVEEKSFMEDDIDLDSIPF